MSHISQGPRITNLAAVAAGIVLAIGVTTPALASTAHPVTHARTASVHKAKATHKTSSSSRHTSKSTDKHTARKAATTHKATATRKAVPHRKAPISVEAVASTPAATTAAQTATAASCANADVIPATANLDLVRAATLCLINQQRALAGLPALAENGALDSQAQSHSQDMVANDYFDHVSPTGVALLSRVVASGFATASAVLDLGENIAAGAGPLATPAATVANWMLSPPHRANILDPTFAETGIGIATAVPAMLGIGSAGATYTQTFGTAG